MTDNIHKCNLCNKNYSSIYNLNKHSEKCKVKITSEDELKCEFCYKVYSSKSTLQNHYQKCLHKKLATTILIRLCIKPVSFNCRIPASTIGYPVCPEHHA